ncbi:MAG: DNA adenine methylase, partial [Helicobacteraceae bacterium]|nr:DNA adenine methylase [Helicobacteraceae bacterium]
MKSTNNINLIDQTEYDELLDFNSNYFVSHLITYIGNKRKLLPFINEAVLKVKKDLKKDKITAIDGFSGSGVVARLLKYHTITLISNDFERYAETVNRAYLANKSDIDVEGLKEAIRYLNENKRKTT